MKQVETKDLRAQLIKSGHIVPDKKETISVECSSCGKNYDQIVGYFGCICGPCEYPTKKRER